MAFYDERFFLKCVYLLYYIHECCSDRMLHFDGLPSWRYVQVYKPISFFSAVIALCLAPMAAEAAVYQKVPGTAVYISVPDSFTLTTDFSGFIDNKSGASILVATMPPASDSVKKLFNDEKTFISAMDNHHYSITSRSRTKSRDGNALLVYQGKQTAANGVFDKWSSMLFAQNASYVITVQAPETEHFALDDAMKIFASVSLARHNDEGDQLSALPFTFGVEPPFEFVGSIMNSSAMLTIPAYTKDSAESPDIVVTKGLETAQGAPLDKVVDNYLNSIKGTVNNVADRKTSHTKFAGHPGLRLQATAEMKGDPVDLVIYAAVGNDGHPIFMHATGEKGTLAAYNDEIEKTADSIQLRNDEKK